MIAVSQPGKIGDALYALPTCKELAVQFGEKVDFYTSHYCEPMRELVEYQPYINAMIVPENYKIENMDMGVQPWEMPIPDGYSQTFQLGYKTWPDSALHQFIGRSAGIDKPLEICYNHPEPTVIYGQQPYVVVAPRSSVVNYDVFLYEVATKLKAHGILSVVVGGPNESELGKGDLRSPWIDNDCGIDMLEVAALMSKSVGFIGAISSQLVIANGFDIPRIALWPGYGYDMRHVIKYHRNFYLANPSSDQVIATPMQGSYS